MTAEDDTAVLLGVEWRAVRRFQVFWNRFDLYKENGFKERKKAEELMQWLQEEQPVKGKDCCPLERKKERKNPPLLLQPCGAAE